MKNVAIIPNPAPLGVGILWLDLLLGISIVFVLLRMFIDNFIVIRLMKKLIKKLTGQIK